MWRWLPILFVPALITVTELLPAGDKLQPAQIMHCHDGDTCTVKVGDAVWFNVRLFGIDSPEVRNQRWKQSQPLGDAAREHLNTLVKDKTVNLKQADLDPYNRPVVEIYLSEKLVNLEMLELGLAEAYRGPTKRLDQKRYFDAEATAKKSKVGIWGLADYVSPSDYRRRHKK